MPKVRKLPRTVLCHQCGKAFYDDAGCKSHGEAKRHTWKAPQPRVALTTLARTTSLPDASSSGCDDAALTTTATASTGDLDLLQKELKGLRGAQVALVSHATFIVNHVSSLPGLHSLALSVDSPTTSKTAGVGGDVPERGAQGRDPAPEEHDEHICDEQLFRILAQRFGAVKTAHIRELLRSPDNVLSTGDAQVAEPPIAPLAFDELSDWVDALYDEAMHRPDSSQDSMNARAVNVKGLPHSPCPICLRNSCIAPVVTPCGHVFCHACIGKELAVHTYCPICRHEILQSLSEREDVSPLGG